MAKMYFDNNMERLVTTQNLRSDYNWIKSNGLYEEVHKRPIPSFEEWVAECIREGSIEEV